MLERARRQRKAEQEAAARRMQEREKGQRGIAQFFKVGRGASPYLSVLRIVIGVVLAAGCTSEQASVTTEGGRGFGTGRHSSS